MKDKGARQRLFQGKRPGVPLLIGHGCQRLGTERTGRREMGGPGPSLPYSGATQTFPHMPLQHLKSLTH